jgi:hypothetical protein
MKKNIDNIIVESKRLEQDALYSFKGHFNAAVFWDKVHLWLGCFIATISVIAGSIIFSEANPEWDIYAGLMALGSGILAAISTFLEPQSKANTFRKAGADYKHLRDQARVLHKIKSSSVNEIDQIIKELEALQAQSHQLSIDSPAIPKLAYLKARKGIKGGEANYNSG